jgi:hypothetical protein
MNGTKAMKGTLYQTMNPAEIPQATKIHASVRETAVDASDSAARSATTRARNTYGHNPRSGPTRGVIRMGTLRDPASAPRNLESSAILSHSRMPEFVVERWGLRFRISARVG